LCGSFEKKGLKLLKKSQDSHGYGKEFSLHMGKNRLFQESFQKNPPEVTPILYMELNRFCVEKLCAKEEK
jgi:hypothetical protein